jgi:hypothetical protein
LINQGVCPSELDLIDDEYMLLESVHRPPRIVKEVKIYGPDEELPEHIQWKLFLARQVALAKFRERHGEAA